MLQIVSERKAIAKQFPNLVEYEGKRAFLHFHSPRPLPAAGTPIEDIRVEKGIFRTRRQRYTRRFERSSAEQATQRQSIRIGMPRVLNMYSTAPWFRTYFETLGVPKANIVFSDPTSDELWTEGGKYGSVDPCFPSKVVQAHIHNLLFHHHLPEKNRPLRYIFFPVLTHVASFVADTMDNASCPIVAGTPNVIRAAFTKETDFFATRGIEYCDPALSFAEPNLLKERMFSFWGARLGVTRDESDFACEQGWAALSAFTADLEEKGRAILDTVVDEDRIAILVLSRPYHSDPGLNHGIPEEFQILGYPILSVRSIPKDRAYLDSYFREELERGVIKSPLQLSHVWPENYSANSAQKVWAANFAAHHPNVAVLDLSSFKCGHDAPTYGLIDSIVQTSKTPTAMLHDIDANKPGGSIKIRVKTYAHSLRLQEERLEDVSRKKRELAVALDRKRLELLEEKEERDGALGRELAQAMAELRERVRAYDVALEEESTAIPASGGGALLQLGKKCKDGSIVRVGAGSHP
jgi:predicted nucleotide-binding protein (sugar kinase/HSP70/actin superfamily)